MAGGNLFKGLYSSEPLSRPQRLARAAAVGAVVCGGAYALNRRRPETVRQKQDGKRFLLPQPLVDAICGAVGEVSQIVLLYPLETIKVRCQADCLSATAVIQNMTRNGWGPHVVQQLYAGLGSAAAFSVVVGAIHWLTFCTAKRAALDIMVQQDKEAKARAVAEGGAVAAAAASSSVVPGKTRKGVSSGSQAGTAHLHVSSGHHMHDEEVLLEHHHNRASGSDGASSSSSGVGRAGSGSGAAAAGGGGGGHGGGLEEAPEGADVGMLASANMVGATVGAIMTALVEGPLELFRHQAQAGLISGNLFREMSNVVKTQGPMGLYWGFLPYCLESFPYDISELATYSQLRDVYNQAVTKANALTGGKASALFGPEAKVPSQLWDIAIGAAAGSAATLISMPFDVIKTYMQTHAGDAVSMSAVAQVQAFFATGQRMVAQHGPGALWVGVVPRLAQQVPSCTICWWAVEACQHWLKPITAPA